MRYPKLRELVEAVRALIFGPYTDKLPRKSAARFRGKPEYSNSGCIACGACELVCPARAIERKETITKDKAVRKMILHLDECHYCGQCSSLCTTRDDMPPGIKHTGEYDLAGSDRSKMVSTTDEKELALCEICQSVITAKAHLEWAAKKIGPLAFSNPTLFLASLKGMGLSEEIFYAAKDMVRQTHHIPSLSRDITRSDRIKVICAECRRKATIERC